MKYTPDEIAELLKDKPHQPHYIAAMVRKAVEAERERCAKPLDEAAARLLAPKRTNDVDRHVASVLESHAKAIRARGER